MSTEDAVADIKLCPHHGETSWALVPLGSTPPDLRYVGAQMYLCTQCLEAVALGSMNQEDIAVLVGLAPESMAN